MSQPAWLSPLHSVAAEKNAIYCHQHPRKVGTLSIRRLVNDEHCNRLQKSAPVAHREEPTQGETAKMADEPTWWKYEEGVTSQQKLQQFVVELAREFVDRQEHRYLLRPPTRRRAQNLRARSIARRRPNSLPAVPNPDRQQSGPRPHLQISHVEAFPIGLVGPLRQFVRVSADRRVDRPIAERFGSGNDADSPGTAMRGSRSAVSFPRARLVLPEAECETPTPFRCAVGLPRAGSRAVRCMSAHGQYLPCRNRRSDLPSASARANGRRPAGL